MPAEHELFFLHQNPIKIYHLLPMVPRAEHMKDSLDAGTETTSPIRQFNAENRQRSALVEVSRKKCSFWLLRHKPWQLNVHIIQYT